MFKRFKAFVYLTEGELEGPYGIVIKGLTDAGFDVNLDEPHIKIYGTYEQFQKIFDADIRKRRRGLKTEYYFEQKPHIPDSLKEWVEEIELIQ
ncbi:MAG: hypothetical protein WAO91_10515 [Candidatus Nitrosotenuis sp.]